jgi:predicted amidophosphoribosyltransferase
MAPALFAQTGDKEKGGQECGPLVPCSGCGKPAPRESRFCPWCGKHLVIFDQCSKCKTSLPPNARFCPQCGTPAEVKKQPQKCSHCGAENLAESVYCNRCGEKI